MVEAKTYSQETSGNLVEFQYRSQHLRDFYGYGSLPPDPEWPNQARVAVSFVLNLEAGAELSISAGDERNESVYEIVQEIKEARDLSMESHFEYETRVGLWRVLDLFEKFNIGITVSICARVLELSPWISAEVIKRGHEVCCHGYRWEHLANMSEAEERNTISQTIKIIEETTGVRPVGWHTRSPNSCRTRGILVEHGFLYDSDAYNDELPYTVEVSGKSHIVLPYSFDTNDMRFTGSETFRLAKDFSTYLINSFDWLWEEGASHPRMMSVGLHPRIIGRPGRMQALKDFLDYLQLHDPVWVTRRDYIARHWQERMKRGDIAIQPLLPGHES